MEIEEKLDSMIKGYEKQNRGLGCLAPLPIVINDLKELKQSLPPEQEKVEVPEFVAEYLEMRKEQFCIGGLGGAITAVFNGRSKPDVCRWMNSNVELFARAWLDGYTVKKGPTVHNLKIGLTYFKAVSDGRKTFEIRNNDRDYKVGDILVLQEYVNCEITDNEFAVKVTYITDYEQKDDYVVLGIVPVEDEAE